MLELAGTRRLVIQIRVLENVDLFRRLLRPRTSWGSIPRNQAERGHGPITVLELARVRQ